MKISTLVIGIFILVAVILLSVICTGAQCQENAITEPKELATEIVLEIPQFELVKPSYIEEIINMETQDTTSKDSILTTEAPTEAPTEPTTETPTEAPTEEVKSSKIFIGNFKITAYCPCKSCSGPWGNSTATGVKAKSNHTIAVDPKVVPYGTKILVGDIVYTAEDCGGAVKGNIIDIYFETHEEVNEFGRKWTDVYIIEE